MRVRAGLRHPVGLILLLASVLMAAAAVSLPTLAQWSARAVWLLLWGLLAYFVTAAVVALSSAVPPYPALRKLRKIRRAIARLLGELKAAGGNAALIPIVDEAVAHIDDDIDPALAQIVTRHETLSKQLQQYEKGGLPLPDALIFEKLRTIHTRQREAIATSIQQAANALAMLLALTQEADEGTVANEARMWAKDLGDLHDGLAEALRGKADYDKAMQRVQEPAGDPAPIAAELDAALESFPPPEVETAPVRLQPAAGRTYPDGLTPREVEVLGLIAAGMTARELATQLVLAVPTVQRHTQNIYVKINARGRADAARYFLKHFEFPQAVGGKGAGDTQPGKREKRVS